MPSTRSTVVSSDFPSSTVMTPSFPTFSMASASFSPISRSLFAAIVPTCAISFLPFTGFEFFLSSSTTAVTARSIRGTDPAAAAPTGLVATLMPAGGVRFTWTDRASDEEGYLLEIRTPGAADYTVAEVLDPDVNSVGLLTLANQRTASVRVRAFYYGAASNTVQEHTG